MRFEPAPEPSLAVKVLFEIKRVAVGPVRMAATVWRVEDVTVYSVDPVASSAATSRRRGTVAPLQLEATAKSPLTCVAQ